VEASELRDLTDAELGAKEEECREALFKLRLRAAVSPLENPMRLRGLTAAEPQPGPNPSSIALHLDFLAAQKAIRHSNCGGKWPHIQTRVIPPHLRSYVW